METWSDQLARVERWLERVRDIRDVKRVGGNLELEDEVRAFFFECWHLRDYLFQGAAPLCTKAEVEAHVARCPALLICADLCNGAKHFIRDAGSIRSGADRRQRTTGIEVIINDSWGGESEPTTCGLHIVVEPGGESAFDIAEDAVRHWKALIAMHGG